jgi:hypothetical protein
LFTRIKMALLGLFFCPTRQNERPVASLHKRMISPGEKTGPALWVAPEKSPISVACR